MKSAIHLFHIAYSAETLASIEPGFQLLDNMDNERPDWFEYWPIRNYLLNHSLTGDDYYGFFSPKFRQKTGMGAEDVREFMHHAGGEVDVFLFSPQPDISAFFINPYEGGDLVDPGKIRTAEEFLKLQGIDINLRTIIMSSAQVVYSNYFVAKASFWRQWISLNEKLFELSEIDNPLKGELTSLTNYPGAQRKVFIMEATASLLLALQSKWRVKPANMFKFTWSGTPLSQFKDEAIICDALKIAFQTQKFPEYIDIYQNIRNDVFSKAFNKKI